MLGQFSRIDAVCVDAGDPRGGLPSKKPTGDTHHMSAEGSKNWKCRVETHTVAALIGVNGFKSHAALNLF
jgi:hypothetical protein